jgi:hypothetical protein
MQRPDSQYPGGIADRPGQGGAGEQWPQRPYRPGQGNWRPGADGSGPRPGGIWGHGGNNVIAGGGNVNTGNIASGNTVNNINNIHNVTNNTVVNNQQSWNAVVNNQQNWVAGNRGGGWGGAYAGGWGYRYPSYQARAYGNWYAGSWSAWPSTPHVWAGVNALAGWLGTAVVQPYTYSNPYLSNAVVTSDSYNYANALPAYVEPAPAVNVNVTQEVADVPATPGVSGLPAEAPAQSTPEDPKVTEAVALLDEGRGLFNGGDYAAAQQKVDRAIRILPTDAVLHEFRGLTLFAQRKYPEAAATLYAVLSAGPGWTWETLYSFYPDADTYTRQLRALELHGKENPRSADDCFLLAYYYLVMGYKDAAANMLDRVRVLLPDDQLSAQLLAALRPQPHRTENMPQPGTG